MSVGSVITRGFSPSVGLLVTRGFSANPYRPTTGGRRVLRVDLYSAAGAKLDVPPLVDNDILGCQYVNAIGKIGTFQLTLAADALSALSCTAGRIVWVYEDNWPVFKGVIRNRDISAASDGKLTLVLTGPSIADQLIGLTTGRGLTFEQATLTSVVTSLCTDTDFIAGSVDTATITARRFDGRTKWDALLATAQAVDCSVREDILGATPKIDMGIFGDDCGITLRNFPESSQGLSDNPYMKQVASLKVKAQSLDLCNRVVPWGQLDGLGGSQLNLGQIASTNPTLPTVTRLYLPSTGTPSISPAFDSGWEKTSAAVRRSASISKISSAMTALNPGYTGTTGDDGLVAQFVFGPIAAQTISGNVKAQIIATEGAFLSDYYPQMKVRVVSSDGLTVRGTLLDYHSYGTEFLSTATNKTWPSTALTSVVASQGDYVVVEIGYHWTSAFSSTAESLRFGDDGSADLPEDEVTTTATLNPWVEFDSYILPGVSLPTGDVYEVLSDTGPDGNLFYYIEDTASQAIYGVRERWVQFKDIMPLGLTSVDFNAAAQTLYGMAVTYLTRHLSEQLAYEVEVLGLKHVNPDTGTPYFKVGDSFRLQFDGWTQDSDGNRTSYLTVDTTLYLLDFTRTFNADGSDTWKLTLSTFLRALPTDGEAFVKLAQDVGIEQVAPLAYFTFGNGAIRMDETSIQLRTNGTDVVAIYGLDELSATPGSNSSYWKLSGQANDAILENDVTLGLYTQGTARSRLYLVYGSFSQAALYVGSDLGFRAGNFNSDVGSYLAPLIQPTLANPSAVSYTIATDAINIDISSYWVNGELEYPGVARVDTEAAAATDNLATISGTSLRRGQLLVVMAKDTTHTVVCKDGTGNLQLAGDMTLDNSQDTLTLMYDGSNWLELARSNNGA